MSENLDKIAEEIADKILNANLEERGKLLLLIGEKLSLKSQSYTASLFLDIAERYGYE